MSGTFNQPRVRALVNGVDVGTPTIAHVTDNNWFRASTFTASFAWSTLSAPPGWFDPQADPSGSEAKLPLEIQAATSAPGSGTPAWASLIQGQVDTIGVDCIAGLVHVSGRDFTARLIDLRISDGFQNKTASQVVTLLAARAGLQADVTSTSTLIGQYYQIDHTQVTHGQFSRTRTAWELMTYLARHEGTHGFDLWVSGQTVHFHPSNAAAGGPVYPVTLRSTPSGVLLNGATELSLDRHLTLDKRIKVTVRSWHARNKKAYQASYPPNASSGAEERSFVRAGLTQQQVTDEAQRRYHEIVRLARRASVPMPGELTLSPRQQLSISGTGLSFDGTYWIESIEREISSDSFHQTVQITNSPPQDDTLL